MPNKSIFPGDFIVTGSLTVTGSTFISSSNATQFQVGSNLLFVSSSGNVGIGTTTPQYKLDINGSLRTNGNSLIKTGDSLSNNIGFEVQNSSGTVFFTILNGGSTRFSRDTIFYSSITCNDIFARNTGLVLNSNGQAATRFTGTVIASSGLSRGVYFNNTVSASANNDTLVGLDIAPTYTVGSFTNVNRLALRAAGSTLLSSSFNSISGSTLTVIGSGSAQPIFTVQGSQGELFSVTDSLSGSLFSVNDISGLPIMEVFSDNTIVMGNYLDPMLITTIYTASVGIGNHILYRLPTSSYDGFWFEYTVRSGSNARAGQMMGIWSGSSVNYTQSVTTDFGSTTDVQLMSTISSGNMIITGSTTTAGWTIKGIIRSI